MDEGAWWAAVHGVAKSWTQLSDFTLKWQPTQYSCLENPRDRRAWWAAVHGVTRSRTRLSDFTFTFHFHALGQGRWDPIPFAQRLVWAAKQALGKAALGALFA